MTQDNDRGVRNWAMLCHLSSLFWILITVLLGILSIPFPIPFLNILGPLVVWLSKKNQHPLIDAHGKESLNFQISFTIYSAIAIVIFFFLISVTCGVGFSSSSPTNPSLQSIGLVLGIGGVVLALIVGILQLILVIFAAVKAKKGEFYHYPFTIRFLR